MTRNTKNIDTSRRIPFAARRDSVPADRYLAFHWAFLSSSRPESARDLLNREMVTIDLSSMPALKYKPLDDATKHIRVLEVWPGDDNEIIQCTLRQADLFTGYACLSYMWGDERDMNTILVNGQK